MAAREARQDQAGFTLIELLIVIIVLGILAGLVMFGVAAFRDDATEEACATDRRQVEKAAQAYFAKHDTTPPESEPAVDPGLATAGFLRSYPAADGYAIDYDRASATEFTVRAVTTTSGEDDNTPFPGCD